MEATALMRRRSSMNIDLFLLSTYGVLSWCLIYYYVLRFYVLYFTGGIVLFRRKVESLYLLED